MNKIYIKWNLPYLTNLNRADIGMLKIQYDEQQYEQYNVFYAKNSLYSHSMNYLR